MTKNLAMTAASLLLALAAPAGAALLGERHRLNLSHTLLVYDNRITGSVKESSYLTPGSFFTDDLGLSYAYTRGDKVFEGAAEGRGADDDRIQTKRFQLKNAYLKFDSPQHSLVAGDYLASFAGYTLNTSLKGASYTAKFSETFQTTLLWGLNKSAWDDVWNHNAVENVDRRFYGLRLAKRFAGEATLGASAVWSKDGRAGTGPGLIDTTTQIQDSRVFGIDWALPTLWGLRLYGESAFSRMDLDNATPFVDENGIEDPTTSDFSKSGFAHSLKADYAFKRFRSQNAFERVSPRFATTGGSSSPDLLQFNTQNTMDILGPWKWVVFNYTFLHDNLDNDTIRPRTLTRVLESGVRYEGPDFRPTFSLESKIRRYETTASDVGLRSRSRSVISSLSERLGPLAVTVDYEFQHEDSSDQTSSSRHHILGLSGSAAFASQSGWKLSPAVRWNLQRDRDNLTLAVDQTGALTANLNLETPWGLDAGGGYSRTLVLPATTGTGSDRRSTSASLGWNILKKSEHRLELRARQNDNRHEAPGLDYKEMVLELSLTNRF